MRKTRVLVTGGAGFLGSHLCDRLKELAEIVIELTGSSSKVVYEPLPSDDPTQRKPLIDLAKKELNWEPRIMLREGLQKTIEYFKNELK